MKWTDYVPAHRLGPSYFRGLADTEDPAAEPAERYESTAIDLLANLLDCGDYGPALNFGDDDDITENDSAVQKRWDAATATLAEIIASAPAAGPEYERGVADATEWGA